MMRNRAVLLIVALMLLAPIWAHAKTFGLTCSEQDGFSVNFTVDTTRNTVEANRAPVKGVYIDQDTISFFVELKGQWWFHVINRNNGTMTVQAPDKGTIPEFVCEQSKQKF